MVFCCGSLSMLIQMNCYALPHILFLMSHFNIFYLTHPLTGASLVAQMVKKSACNVGDPGSIPGLGRSLEKETATHFSIMPRESHGQTSRVTKSWTQLSDSHTHPLTKYYNHSFIYLYTTFVF